MPKRARLNRTEPENVAIRAQVDALQNQGLPLDQAQAVAFKMFKAGQIQATAPTRAAKTSRGIMRNILRRKAKTAAAVVTADIIANRRTKSGRKRRTKPKK